MIFTTSNKIENRLEKYYDNNSSDANIIFSDDFTDIYFTDECITEDKSESDVDNVSENESLPQSHFIYGKNCKNTTGISG